MGLHLLYHATPYSDETYPPTHPPFRISYPPTRAPAHPCTRAALASQIRVMCNKFKKEGAIANQAAATMADCTSTSSASGSANAAAKRRRQRSSAQVHQPQQPSSHGRNGDWRPPSSAAPTCSRVKRPMRSAARAALEEMAKHEGPLKRGRCSKAHARARTRAHRDATAHVLSLAAQHNLSSVISPTTPTVRSHHCRATSTYH